MDNLEPRGTIAAFPHALPSLSLNMAPHVDAHASILIDHDASDTHNATIAANGTTITVTPVEADKIAIAEVVARSTKDGQNVDLAQVVTIMPAPAKTLNVTITDERESAIPMDSVLRDVALAMSDENGRMETGLLGFRVTPEGLIATPKGAVTARGANPERVVVIGHAKDDGEQVISVLVNVTVIPASEA